VFESFCPPNAEQPARIISHVSPNNRRAMLREITFIFYQVVTYLRLHQLQAMGKVNLQFKEDEAFDLKEMQRAGEELYNLTQGLRELKFLLRGKSKFSAQEYRRYIAQARQRLRYTSHSQKIAEKINILFYFNYRHVEALRTSPLRLRFTRFSNLSLMDIIIRSGNYPAEIASLKDFDSCDRHRRSEAYRLLTRSTI
jgi:hypothetical protein